MTQDRVEITGDTILNATDNTFTKTPTNLDWAPNPTKATLWALIPGGGQVYNWAHHDKWWAASLKLTVIYGGLGVLTWQILGNTQYYRDFRDAYKWVSSEGASGNQNEYTNGQYSASQLQAYMDHYQSNMEWCYFFTGLLYALQIVEATVTAHLLTFDVSEDLSFGISPIQTRLPLPQPTLPQHFGLSMRYQIHYK